MKKSELLQLIKEEYVNVTNSLNEMTYEQAMEIGDVAKEIRTLIARKYKDEDQLTLIGNRGRAVGDLTNKNIKALYTFAKKVKDKQLLSLVAKHIKLQTQYQNESVTEQVLTEGVNDPGILKAVFMAGGPGSGKGFALGKTLGVPEDVMKGTSSLGLKIINSDAAFEKNLKDKGFDPKNLDKVTDRVFKYYTTGDNSAREKAKITTKKLQQMYETGRLGLVIDGTGHQYEKIKTMKDKLDALGYDTSMLFINTSLDVAKQRNQQRERVVPEDILEKSWKDVQNNMGKFQSLFKNNFDIIDNSEIGDFNKMHKDKISKAMKFVKSPVKNPIGKNWIENQKKIRDITK